jgi:hypothetical protein
MGNGNFGWSHSALIFLPAPGLLHPSHLHISARWAHSALLDDFVILARSCPGIGSNCPFELIPSSWFLVHCFKQYVVLSEFWSTQTVKKHVEFLKYFVEFLKKNMLNPLAFHKYFVEFLKSSSEKKFC